MRRCLALLTLTCLTACSGMQSFIAEPLNTETRPMVLTPYSSGRPPTAEIRLLDSRVIQAWIKASKQMPMVSLNGPQKTAVIVGAALAGAWLLGELIEDELSLPPGP